LRRSWAQTLPTSGHPLLTRNAYMPAKNICRKLTHHSMHDNDIYSVSRRLCTILFQRGKERDILNNQLFIVQQIYYSNIIILILEKNLT
jgi:hypothetical protein